MQSEIKSIQKMNGTEIIYRNPAEYEKFIRRHYDCMRAKEYSVLVTDRLYYRATRDQKIKHWFENNLSLLPDCMKNLRDIVAVTGGRIISCSYHMINYNNISTEVCVADEMLSSAAGGALVPTKRSVIRTTNVREIEGQAKYNSIFWTPEIKSAGFHAQA